MDDLFANSGDPDQMQHSAESDLGLHYLPITLLGSPDYNRLKICVYCWVLKILEKYGKELRCPILGLPIFLVNMIYYSEK